MSVVTQTNAIYYAVSRHDIASVRTLLQAGGNPNRHEPQDGWTPLILAIRTQQWDMVQLLIGGGASPAERSHSNRDAWAYAQERSRYHHQNRYHRSVCPQCMFTHKCIQLFDRWYQRLIWNTKHLPSELEEEIKGLLLF